MRKKSEKQQHSLINQIPVSLQINKIDKALTDLILNRGKDPKKC